MNTLTKRNRKPKYNSPKDALLAKLPVGDPDSCWEWPAARTKNGYGVFTHQHRLYYAHRVSYSVFNGPLSDSLDVCHTCDNPACCNPAHLWLGTPTDNAEDMVSKGRNGYKTFRGESSNRSKLTEPQVRTIFKLAKEGMNQADVGKAFGVSQSCVMAIVTRRTWKHLNL